LNFLHKYFLLHCKEFLTRRICSNKSTCSFRTVGKTKKQNKAKQKKNKTKKKRKKKKKKKKEERREEEEEEEEEEEDEEKNTFFFVGFIFEHIFLSIICLFTYL
jgi:hypothetical protein